jgi:hypothetical protein
MLLALLLIPINIAAPANATNAISNEYSIKSWPVSSLINRPRFLVAIKALDFLAAKTRVMPVAKAPPPPGSRHYTYPSPEDSKPQAWRIGD